MLFDVISSIFTNSQVLQHLIWTFYLISTACLFPVRNVTNWWVMRDVIWDRWDHHHDVEAEFHGQYLGEQPTAAGRGAAWCYIYKTWEVTLQTTNISHLGKRKNLDSKVPFGNDMLVSGRVEVSTFFVVGDWVWCPWHKDPCMKGVFFLVASECKFNLYKFYMKFQAENRLRCMLYIVDKFLTILKISKLPKKKALFEAIERNELLIGG